MAALLRFLVVLMTSFMAINLANGKPAAVTSPPITAAPDAPTTTTTAAISTRSVKCDYAYCDEKDTSWCFYFVPIKTFDPKKGPIPGETRVSIGSCGPKATAVEGEGE